MKESPVFGFNRMSLNDHSARGSAAGFTYQFERAFYWLCQSPSGSVIGVEAGDDISVSDANGQLLLLEQDKHSVREEGRPFGDLSKDLWNTLATWIGALESDEVPYVTRFLMVTNKQIGNGIARKISEAKDEKSVDACVKELEVLSRSISPTIASLSRRVLAEKSREHLRTVVSRCELVDAGNGSAGGQLLELSISHLQIPEWCLPVAESIADELLGWLHRNILSLWQRNKPGWIARDHFVNQFHAILSLRKRRQTRERSELFIPINDSSIGRERGRPFVRQLHLITDDETVIDTAIREYVRCGIEKFRLSAEGNITDEDWEAFEAALQSRWHKIHVRVIRMRRELSEIDQGFEVFTESTENYREKLAGDDTEQVYLTSGTYHRLADATKVGWHPRFNELMKKEEDRE